MALETIPRLSTRGRLLAVATALLAASPLVTAATLSPAPLGHGTHQALGLPACGWQTAMGLPCPTCGMTTAFAHAVRADFLSAAIAQPAGLLLSLLAAMACLGGAFAAITGAPMQRLGATMLRPAVIWVLLAIVLAGWGFKLFVNGANP